MKILDDQLTRSGAAIRLGSQQLAERNWEPGPRHRATVIGGVAAVAAVTLIVAGTAWLMRTDEARAPDSATSASTASGLGSDGPAFILDEPGWTLIEMFETGDGHSTFSLWEQAGYQVAIATGSVADELTATWQLTPGDGVSEASFGEGFGFTWTTTDGIAVAITVRSPDLSIARTIAGGIRSVDGITWERLRAGLPCVSVATTVAPDLGRSGELGPTPTQSGQLCTAENTGTTLAPTTTVVESVTP